MHNDIVIGVDMPAVDEEGMPIDDGRLPDEQPGVVFDVSHGFRASLSFVEDAAEWNPDDEARELRRGPNAPPEDPSLVEEAAVLGDIALRAASAEVEPWQSTRDRLRAVADGFRAPEFAARLLAELRHREL